MPPTRRRPVPSPPTTTGRPRVAGLRKRPDHPTPPATPDDVDARHTAPAGYPATSEPDTSPPTEDLPDAPDGSPSAEDWADPPFVEDLAEAPDIPDEQPKPRPTPKRERDGAQRRSSAEPTSEPDQETAPTRSNTLLPIALVVVAAVLVGLGVWFQAQAGNAKYNKALVDSAGTTEVSGQVREAVEKAFSYNFADVTSTEKAAGELLQGKAKCQYNAIFGPVKTLAPEQKLVVTVKAVSSGVTSLDNDRATVLLFLDQVTTRTTDNQSGGGIAMMRAGAQKTDGRWKVDNMEMFGQNGDQSTELAKCN